MHEVCVHTFGMNMFHRLSGRVPVRRGEQLAAVAEARGSRVVAAW